MKKAKAPLSVDTPTDRASHLPVASNWRLGLGFTLITCVMWGLLPLALDNVLAVMDPITIAWYRFSISALIALAWYGNSSAPKLRTMFRASHRVWSTLAVLGLSGNYMLYNYGLDYTNPGAAQILIQLAPLLLLIASVILLNERFGGIQWLGVMGFTLGLLLFFNQRISTDVATDSTYGAGVMILMASAVAWTCYGLAQKNLLRHFHAKDILLLICLAGSVLLLPLSQPLQILEFDATQLILLLFCGINTLVAYGAFGLAMSHWEASKVSAIVPLAPLFTLIFTYAFNAVWDLEIAAEPLNWLGAFGALLVVVGCAIAAFPRARKHV